MSRRGRSASPAGSGSPRGRLLAAAGAVARRLGWEEATVERICEEAGVSKRTFYALFADRQACLAAAIDEAADELLADIAGTGEEPLAVGHRRLARALQDDPARAWMTVVEPRAHRRACHVEDATSGTRALLVLAGEVVARERRAPTLEELAESTIYLDLAPVLGRRAALEEARRPITVPAVPRRSPAKAATIPAPRLSVLARATLHHLAANPGDSNVAVAAAVGIRLESQASRHLRALERSGLVGHVREGRQNRWQLTTAGHELVAVLQ